MSEVPLSPEEKRRAAALAHLDELVARARAEHRRTWRATRKAARAVARKLRLQRDLTTADYDRLVQKAVAKRRAELGLHPDASRDVDPFQAGWRPTTVNWTDAVRSVSDRPDDGTPLADVFLGR